MDAGIETAGHGGEPIADIAARCDAPDPDGRCPICRDEACVICGHPEDCEHDTDERHGWAIPGCAISRGESGREAPRLLATGR